MVTIAQIQTHRRALGCLTVMVVCALVAAIPSSLRAQAVLTGYVGLLLMGSAFLAVGLFASSLTENQIVAAVTTFGILLMFWVLGWGADAAGGAWWGKLLQHLSITEHFESFGKGVFETKDIIYYVNFTILALFLTLPYGKFVHGLYRVAALVTHSAERITSRAP